MSQRDTAWIDARLGMITASKFACALAGDTTKTRQRYKDDLIDERIGLLSLDDRRVKPWFAHGLEQEPRAIAAFAFFIGGLFPDAEMTPTPDFIRHTDGHRAGCSPDAVLRMDGQWLAGVEIKCRATSESFYKAVNGPMELTYRAQIMGGLWVTGTPYWWYVNYTEDERVAPENRLHVQKIQRDEKYIARLADAVLRLDAEVQAEADAILLACD